MSENTESRPYDAQQVAEEIANSENPPTKVDVSADYEASKEFSTSPIDDTEEGAKAAEAATAPDFKVPEAEETHAKAEPTGNPDDYREMARDVGHSEGATGNVDDDLVKKAIDLGQPGQ